MTSHSVQPSEIDVGVFLCGPYDVRKDYDQFQLIYITLSSLETYKCIVSIFFHNLHHIFLKIFFYDPTFSPKVNTLLSSPLFKLVTKTNSSNSNLARLFPIFPILYFFCCSSSFTIIIDIQTMKQILYPSI